MRTSKPISTISYNTADYLVDVLERLRYLKTISYYEFIYHLPDKDDKKSHIHLYIEPNRVIDTEVFSSNFIQYVFSVVINKNKVFKHSRKFNYFKFNNLKSKFRYSSKLKPLRCIHWQSSKYGDWYWYAIHDKDYLKAKMLERNCFYTDADVFTCDKDTHIYKVSENPLINYANMSDVALRDYIFDCISQGQSLQYLLNSCKVPLGKVQSVIHFYNALAPYYSPKKEIKQVPLNYNAVKNSRFNTITNNLCDIANGLKPPLDNDFVFDKNYDDLY